jgi:DNA-binding IclR family transcriptional regulator
VTAADLAHEARPPEKGLGLALEVLEQVARHPQGATAAEIARAVGAPRASVYRVVNSLVRDEYLVRRPDLTGFLLGARVLELAAVVDAHRRPDYSGVLDALRAETGEAVHLFAFRDGGVAILDEDPRSPISDRAALLGDPTRSAVGHLWLVGRSDDGTRGTRWRVRAQPADVEAIAEAYAIRGYTEQAALLAPDRGCLAVPISNDHHEPIGAVSLATPVSRLSVAARHVARLRGAAASLSSTAL